MTLRSGAQGAAGGGHRFLAFPPARGFVISPSELFSVPQFEMHLPSLALAPLMGKINRLLIYGGQEVFECSS